MALLHVNPTRMELTRLKKRLVTARRGHKLLKDKRDELMRQFLELVRGNKALRRKVEEAILAAHRHFVVARSLMQRQAISAALMIPKQELRLTVGKRNVMSVDIPVYTAKFKSPDANDIYPYGYAFTSGDLDGAIEQLSAIQGDLLRLAECEKSAQLMAAEIEKTRRRVNALEHILIPQLEGTIRHITMKLEENERGNITRLMKVKDMMLEKAHGYK